MNGLRLGEELGAGAVATVFRVEDAQGQAYAGKVLHESRRGEVEAADRFAREAEVVRAVEHENVVRVFGQVEVDDRNVLLMELVEGTTLEATIALDAPLDATRIIAIAKGIAAGLVAAHDAGVIHRDLKPSNVLLTAEDIPKIADFGMARASSFAGVDRSAFAVLGTPDYMAPESLDPLAVDARSDLYALGCIMFEMATGRPPFAGATSFGVIEQHRIAPIPSLDGTSLPSAVRALIEALLQKESADRPQSASAVVDALTQERGLVVQTATVAQGGRCAKCSALLVDSLRLCLSCQTPTPRLEPGDHTVFITGPGETASKLDSQHRGALVSWLNDNPTLGLDAPALAKKIPRLPFALVRRVDGEAAKRLVDALRLQGLEAEAALGGVFALPAARKKARTMGTRALGVVATSLVGLNGVVMDTPWLIPVYLLAFLIAPLVTAFVGARAKGSLSKDVSSLPPALAQRMDAVSKVGAGMSSRRHRESLRGVVSRVLQLREAGGGDGGALDDEASQAIDQAIVATGQLDIIDQKLEGADLREANDEVHALMQQRDRWSARLLDLTGTLDSLRARLAAARGTAGNADEEVLDRLRAKVEALEEVQNT